MEYFGVWKYSGGYNDKLDVHSECNRPDYFAVKSECHVFPSRLYTVAFELKALLMLELEKPKFILRQIDRMMIQGLTSLLQILERWL